MAAISTNAIPAANAPAPAKANGNDTKAPADDSFAALLNAANAQAPVQPAAADDKNSPEETTPAQDTAAPAGDGEKTDGLQPKPEMAQKDGPAKPQAKAAETANDNDPADALAKSTAQAGEAGVTAQAQVAFAQTTVPPPQQTAANEGAGETEEPGAIDATQPGTKSGAKPGAKPTLPAPAADDSAAAAAQSPVAAAQAGITGTNNNGGNKDGRSAKDAETSEKPPVKTASAADAPKPDAPLPSQQAQGQTAQPQPAAASFTVSASDAPVQSNSAHSLSTSVDVAPQPAHSAPDLNTLAVEIASRSQSGARQFSIRLDPPELGRVDVRLSIDATGKAEAHLTADHPDTLNLLQKDSSILSRALREAGLDVSRDGLNFSLRNQNGQAGNEHGHQGRGPKSNLAATRVIDAAQNTSSIRFTSAGNGRLDIHV